MYRTAIRFIKDPEDNSQRLIEPETAGIVMRIFQMSIEGSCSFQIAHILCDEKIERLSYYFVRMGLL